MQGPRLLGHGFQGLSRCVCDKSYNEFYIILSDDLFDIYFRPSVGNSKYFHVGIIANYLSITSLSSIFLMVPRLLRCFSAITCRLWPVRISSVNDAPRTSE